jgi:alpha-1,2-mannosyltransferase
MWLIVEDVLAPPHRRLRGMLTGLATGIKLTPAIFVCSLALGRRWRDVGVAAVAAASTVAIGFLMAPQASRDFWLGGVIDPERVGGVEFAGNQSLNGLVWRLMGAGGSTVLWLILASGVALAGVIVAKAWWRIGGAVGATVTLALVGMLISPISWSHHWTWIWLVVPLIGALSQRLRQAGQSLAAVAGIGLLAMWVITTLGRSVWWLPHRDGAELGRGPLLAFASSPYVVLGIATVLWLGIAALAVRRISGPVVWGGPSQSQSGQSSDLLDAPN